MERSILRGGVRTTIHDSGNMTEFPLLGKCTQIDAFVRGASRRTMSSLALGWSGMVIERHSADAAERQESFSPHHILALWETHTFQTEHCDAHGAVVRVKKNPGWIDFFPAGILSSCRSTGPSKMVVCAFNPEFAKEVAEDLGLGSAGDLTGFSTTEDETLRNLVKIVVSEAEMDGVHGRLYADHLAHALITHILFLVKGKKRNKYVSGLPNHLLQRVLSRMRADLATDIKLSALAAECGYSRTHFLRMFQIATGYTPHQYLLHLRLQAARQMLKQRSRSIIEIAADCGFSSHAHLSRTFRRIIGITPSAFRRNL